MAHVYRWRRLRWFAAVLGCLAAASCRLTDLALWRPGDLGENAVEVMEVRGVPYAEGPLADDVRQRLDLYLPGGQRDFPVVVLVHGGVWMMGDNRSCGLHSSVGEFLASQGIGAVLPNYRLSPAVKHPEHVKDLARAVAWTKTHIAEYGGRADQLFLVGHSAGGHLVALLGTDSTYLEGEGLKLADLRGVIAVSGVYNIPPGKLDLTLGGASARAFRFDEMFPVRGGSGRVWPPLAWLPGLPIRLDIYGPAFGDDAQVRADASPVHHVRPGLPPFLLFTAENDLPTLPGMAEEFQEALCTQGCDARLLKVKDRNHNSILFRAVAVHDPVASAMLDFIRQHAEATRSSGVR
jgi:acetyl esterase/lipase